MRYLAEPSRSPCRQRLPGDMPNMMIAILNDMGFGDLNFHGGLEDARGRPPLGETPSPSSSPGWSTILSPHALGVLVHPGKGRLAYLNVESATQMAGTELGEHFSQRGALTRRADRGMRPAAAPALPRASGRTQTSDRMASHDA